MTLPFFIRRLWLLARGTMVSRDDPRLDKLASIEDPERFVWAILPHAARSFASSILLLPEHEARAAAVGYLYARMLDTYEDLSPSPQAARTAIAAFARRFDADPPSPPPALADHAGLDSRDRTHLLLISRHQLVDDVFLELDEATRHRIGRLIVDMGSGMSHFVDVFERQGGVLVNDQQVLDYCHHVIGLPALFMMKTLLGRGSDAFEADAVEVAELIQLANITRDIEKDLRRGIAYHPALRPHLGSDGLEIAASDIARARRDLMLMATKRAPSFRRLIGEVDLPRLSPARSAAVMMMLFTDRHYRRCAVDAGLETWSGPRRMPTMVLASLPAALSPWWANRVLLRVERDLLAAA